MFFFARIYISPKIEFYNKLKNSSDDSYFYYRIIANLKLGVTGLSHGKEEIFYRV